MKTIVFDDDPTGTQSASNVPVLLQWDAAQIAATLRDHDAVYLLTNTRAIAEDAAIALLTRTRGELETAATALGEALHVVLRGDSTLRGHVFSETEVFAGDEAPILFVPAFPEGGRTTVEGTHYVQEGERRTPAHETEYAEDPVFPFAHSYLPEYVAEKTERPTQLVPIETVRGPLEALAEVFANVAPTTVLLPDAETAEDIRRIAAAVHLVWEQQRPLVVRSGSPLAAAIAGVESAGLLERPIVPARGATLLVCGSHTNGATRQLERVALRHEAPVVISTDAAMHDPKAEAALIAEAASHLLERDGFATVASERTRRAEHNTLAHGERVMDALTTIVSELRHRTEVVVSKGGITSAEVARLGLGADRAMVLGQVLPGVSVWQVTTPEGAERKLVVVPGNVGAPETIDNVLRAVGR
ncbi:four-carbon acid sugar kinase family protein [Humidisolicoccus flavus]|uniref:four-carbon acid sugar kinase family protein n=1 Tax=Humidisolicoccus flavus TaxID=3111414 RepID=UPI0032483801